MISSKEEDSLKFLQYVEDYGLRAYNRLVSQNITHEWNEKNWIKFQGKIDKKQKQEEAIKRGEELNTEGKHLRMGSMSMPAPVEHMSPHQHQPPCNPGFTVRSQSLHSVEGGEEEGSPTSRKQPPPKPRRDPSTKLSISSEAVDLSPTGSKGNDSERCDGTQGCIEDCRKVPPPKPKRNPNTQLIEIKGKGHSSEYKREHKERSHHSKESKRDKDRSSNGKSLHRRDSKDREPNGIEALFRHDSKDCGYSNTEPLTRSDNKDRGYNCPELLPRQESKDRGSSSEALPQRDSKDRGCNNAEPFARHDSKDRGCVGPEHLPRDCKDLLRNGPDSRRNSRENVCYGIDLLSRHENKDLGRTGLERQRDKDGGKHVIESGKDKEKSNHSAESRRGSKERITNGNDVMSRWDCKDRGVHTNETLPRYNEKDKSNYSTESPKAQDKDARPGSSAMASSTRSGRSSMIPNIMLGNSNSGNFLAELKTLPKVGRSSSTTVAPSPKGTPQRQSADVQQMPPMPWLYSDSNMVEMIERKQRLCREIRSRERLPDRSPCKKESLPTMPSWKKTSGAKKHSPPPYPTQTTVFWDTAI
ncbi:neuronal tyrosine-phosphorylated phosphoinositide-3-kinase adapter 2 [Sinocyclocheilus grahami]|uniref:neuronal tyrosine-phosphorylated phosphoinositide-3-kinase adapter 2 n=1 Tax=Sinocyclocheilus grahami TaxID=75366 RepID=UPI0007ACEFD2|nr:PREDICTED: neuronal tyrosine-phosphorylated phosphoinositide-3-kinase adapter 2-like [Sinocyclocheilus grahami]